MFSDGIWQMRICILGNNIWMISSLAADAPVFNVFNTFLSL